MADAGSIVDSAFNTSQTLVSAAKDAAYAITHWDDNISTSTVINFGGGTPLTLTIDDITPDPTPIVPSTLAVTVPSFDATYTDPSAVVLDVGSPPTAQAGMAPILNIGATPSLSGLPDPISYIGDTSVNFPTAPTAPDLALPDAPILMDIIIPAPPVLNLPTFASQRPQDLLPANKPEDISNYYGFTTETGRVYQSLTLQQVEDKMLSDIQTGGTGISADVQNAIWNQAIERDAIALNDAIIQLEDQYAHKGFPVAPGQMRKDRQDLIERFTATRSETNRTVVVKIADLAQKNTQFAIDELLKGEDLHIRYAIAFADRMLAVAKATSDAAIAWINAQVVQFNARLEAYKADAQVFEELLRAEVQKIEIFRTELEAAKIQGDLNLQQVEIYKARVSALQVGAELYSAMINAYGKQIDAERSKVEVIKVRSDIYASLVQAKGFEIQAFDAQVRGETAKVTAYQAQVEADNSKMKGFATLVDAKAREAEVNTANARTYTERFNALVAQFRAQVEALTAQSSTAANAFKAQVDAYNSKLDAQKARAAVQEAKGRLDVAHWQTESTLSVEQARVMLSYIQEAQKIDNLKRQAAAQVYAEMAKGALSSVNAIAQTIVSSSQ